MEPSARARGYDLFKLIVTIVLLFLFLFLLWRGDSGSPAATPALLPLSETPSHTLTATVTPAAVPVFSPTATQTSRPNASPTVPATVSPTSTPLVTSTAIAVLTPTSSATAAVTASPTFTPEITSTIPATIEATSTATAEAPSKASACERALAFSHLQVGMNATILRRLNFRSSPGIGNNWLLTSQPGTQVEIVGGPTCLPHFVGAYLWWQIKLPDGRIGWSAEASLRGAFYFMEPVP